jgi:dTDP-4-dehydrorhamnose 3,5-epimerase
MGEIEGVRLTPLNVIHVPEGDVYHALKASDPGYVGFGEAYFSTIHPGSVKPWKRHLRMTLNLIVVRGRVRFVVHDDRPDSLTRGLTREYRIGFPDGYARLTIGPGLWMAFQGLAGETSLLLNVADIAHDPEEAIRGGLDDYPFDWSIK